MAQKSKLDYEFAEASFKGIGTLQWDSSSNNFTDLNGNSGSSLWEKYVDKYNKKFYNDADYYKSAQTGWGIFKGLVGGLLLFAPGAQWIGAGLIGSGIKSATSTTVDKAKSVFDTNRNNMWDYYQSLFSGLNSNRLSAEQQAKQIQTSYARAYEQREANLQSDINNTIATSDRSSQEFVNAQASARNSVGEAIEQGAQNGFRNSGSALQRIEIAKENASDEVKNAKYAHEINLFNSVETLRQNYLQGTNALIDLNTQMKNAEDTWAQWVGTLQTEEAEATKRYDKTQSKAGENIGKGILAEEFSSVAELGVKYLQNKYDSNSAIDTAAKQDANSYTPPKTTEKKKESN